jgi:hypothetical protein
LDRHNLCLRIGIKIIEQPFMTNPGISSSPRDLGCFGLLMILQTSASEIGAKDKDSEECPYSNGYYKHTENAYRKHQQLH